MCKSTLGYDLHTPEVMNFWSQNAKFISLTESYFEGNIANPEFAAREPGAQNHREMQIPTFTSFPPGGEFMDFMDDVWMGPSDYQR
jgi:hypothetical protein